MSPREQHPENALYRFYGATGELLYLGVTHDPKQRWAQHRRTQHWWLDVARTEVEWVGDRATAEAAELAALEAEKPRYDRHLSGIYRNEVPSTVRRHADPEAERKIQNAVRVLAHDIRAGVFPQWTVMPSMGSLSDRYSMPVMAVDTALSRLDFQENLVARLDGRTVVVDPREFSGEGLRGHRLTLVLLRHHFEVRPFTAALAAASLRIPLNTMAQHIRLLTRDGAVRKKAAAQEFFLAP
ncbi:GIY-YIG nuclease family protein [Streptomyces sp. t39]|uniref:GIY-YIG nuclease family protein n=1 Tax=Streptomyces sp. t39 TaxID=1828156 RepID=UPI0011CD9905|nr:GIY-YIG nuclease family protein [Streptomyces sp. t39]TXS50159.1 GIY-YIG nuclease family protein [Streptomyces sp. t39]